MDEEPITSVPNFIKGILVIGALAALVTAAVEYWPEGYGETRLLELQCRPNKKPTDEFSVRCDVELRETRDGLLRVHIWQFHMNTDNSCDLASAGIDETTALAQQFWELLKDGNKQRMTLRLRYRLDGFSPDFIIVGVDSWD